MSRTTPTLVESLLGADYGPLPDGTFQDLQQFCDTANSLVNRAVVCANAKGYFLSGTDLEIIERWMAAWAYTQSDKTLASKSTSGGSGSFQGQTGMGFESNNYGMTAMRLDYSNCLRNMDKQQRAKGVWLGSVPQCDKWLGG